MKTPTMAELRRAAKRALVDPGSLVVRREAPRLWRAMGSGTDNVRSALVFGRNRAEVSRWLMAALKEMGR